MRAATAAALAAVVLVLAACGHQGATQAQHDEAHRAARLWCSMMSGATSLYSDEFINCVKDREPTELAEIVKRDAKAADQ